MHFEIVAFMESIFQNGLQLPEFISCVWTVLRLFMSCTLDVLEIQLASPHFVHEKGDSILAYVFVRGTLNVGLELVEIFFEVILGELHELISGVHITHEV